MPVTGKAARGFEVGDHAGPYEILGTVGVGGMATVHVARRTGYAGLETDLALKAVLPHLLESPRVVEMFLDEIRMSSRVESPHVVRVLDAGETAGRPWMVMELLRGKTLAELLSRGPLPTREALSVLQQVATGLHAAHETRGPAGEPLELVHRDVSPQNVHVGYDGVAKLVDFGIARAVGRVSRTTTGEIKGKLAYAPPELFEGQPADRRSDLFSFGVVAYEALSGERLFAGETDAEVVWNVLHKEVPALHRVNSDVPPDVSAVIGRCLERGRASRPRTAESVALCLERWAAELGGNPRRVGELVRHRFGAELAREEEERIARASTGARATSSVATSSEATSDAATSSEATSSEATSSEATSSEATSSEATSDAALPGDRTSEAEAVEAARPAPALVSRRSRHWIAAAGVTALLLALGAGGVLATRAAREPAQRAVLPTAAEPAPPPADEAATSSPPSGPAPAVLTASAPETAEPEAADPETADPETADPEAADPETADREAADPETADPETADPETADPETADPETAEPAPAPAPVPAAPRARRRARTRPGPRDTAPRGPLDLPPVLR